MGEKEYLICITKLDRNGAIIVRIIERDESIWTKHYYNLRRLKKLTRSWVEKRTGSFDPFTGFAFEPNSLELPDVSPLFNMDPNELFTSLKKNY